MGSKIISIAKHVQAVLIKRGTVFGSRAGGVYRVDREKPAPPAATSQPAKPK